MIRSVLLPDGPTDRRLAPALRWALSTCSTHDHQLTVADVSILHTNGRTVEERLAAGILNYPADFYFVHRDAEAQGIVARYNEIAQGVIGNAPVQVVPVVPVRMQEAWLLCDEQALRRAAGNPNGRVSLNWPRLAQVEAIADPKTVLKELVLEASETRGRRRRDFNVSGALDFLAELIPDYSRLRLLSSFRQFESHLRELVLRNGW